MSVTIYVNGKEKKKEHLKFIEIKSENVKRQISHCQNRILERFNHE
ncbi:MAG: hypothetical protein HFI75_08665 [Lachnospiraceae bacterium]|nr:hypothetical protein [Lachnospiraceae bacterium]